MSSSDREAGCIVGGAHRNATNIVQATLESLDEQTQQSPEQIYKGIVRPLKDDIIDDMLNDIEDVKERLNGGNGQATASQGGDGASNTSDDDPYLMIYADIKSKNKTVDDYRDIFIEKYGWGASGKGGYWIRMRKSEWTSFKQKMLDEYDWLEKAIKFKTEKAKKQG